MPRSGTGTYTLPALNPVVTGSTVSSTWANNTLNDLATAMTGSVAADGQTPILANIPMNSKKLTGLAAATTSGDALSYGQASMGPIDATTIAGTTGTFNGAVATGSLTTTGNVSISGTTTAKGVGLVAVKSATTSRASTTSNIDDPHLIIALPIGTFAVDGWIPIWGTVTGAMGIKIAMAFSGTQTNFAFSALGYFGGSGAFNGGLTSAIGSGNGFANGSVTIGSGATSADWLRIGGMITVTVAGNISIQWAQFSSNVNNLNFGIGGWLNCTKLA